MSTAEQTKRIIKKLRAALNEGSSEKAQVLIQAIRLENPSQWLNLIALALGPIDPRNPTFFEKISAINRAAEDFTPEEQHTLRGYESIARAMHAASRESEKSEFWKSPRLTMMWRLFTYVESQYIFVSNTIRKKLKRAPPGSPFVMASPSIEVPGTEGAATTSVDLVFESTAEAAELILRISMHRTYTQLSNGKFTPQTPYEDPDFGRLLACAHAWHRFSLLWNQIQYTDWRPAHDPRGFIWTPKNKAQYLQSEIGNIRERLFLQQAMLSDGLGPGSELKNRREVLERLKRSFNFPKPGKTWDLKIDIQALQDLLGLDRYATARKIYMSRRFLAPVMGASADPELEKSQKELKLNFTLHELAMALLQKNRETFKTKSAPCNIVFAVTKQRLCKVISEASGIEFEFCFAHLKNIVFDAERKNLEIWDQPLVPIDDHRVLFVPSIIANSHPIRTIEHLASARSNSAFDSRGEYYEQMIQSRLEELTQAVAVRGIKFPASDGRQIEYDLVLYWQGHLFIFELKCLKMTTTPVDEFGAREELEHAEHQLVRRVSIAETDWKEFRSQARGISLPESPPARRSIHAIILTNIMNFTGRRTGEIVTTDDSCLFRYFDSPHVPVFDAATGAEISSIARLRLRNEGAPSASGLWQYLSNPPQLEWMRKQIRPEYHPLPPLDEGNYHWKLMAAFDPANAQTT